MCQHWKKSFICVFCMHAAPLLLLTFLHLVYCTRTFFCSYTCKRDVFSGFHLNQCIQDWTEYFQNTSKIMVWHDTSDSEYFLPICNLLNLVNNIWRSVHFERVDWSGRVVEFGMIILRNTRVDVQNNNLSTNLYEWISRKLHLPIWMV